MHCTLSFKGMHTNNYIPILIYYIIICSEFEISWIIFPITMVRKIDKQAENGTVNKWHFKQNNDATFFFQYCNEVHYVYFGCTMAKCI